MLAHSLLVPFSPRQFFQWRQNVLDTVVASRADEAKLGEALREAVRFRHHMPDGVQHAARGFLGRVGQQLRRLDALETFEEKPIRAEVALLDGAPVTGRKVRPGSRLYRVKAHIHSFFTHVDS